MIGVELGPQEQIAADQFRSFYASLLAIRESIRTPAHLAPIPDSTPAEPTIAATPAAAASAPTPATRAPTIDQLRTRLAQAIGDLGYRHDDLQAGVPLDTGYVMAAVADEVLLVQCPDWAEYDAWADRPLEAVLYGTRRAGDRIFEAADDLVARQRTDPRAATTILLALLTGFRGRYQGEDDGGRIAALQVRLYALVCDRAYAPDDRLPYVTPDLAATALEGPSVRPLPALWPWLALLALVVLAYFPVSHILWWSQVRSVDALADKIVEFHNDSGASGGADR